MTDPFRPRARAARLDRSRLLRAGLSDATADSIVGQFEALSLPERHALARWVDTHSDGAIRERFAGLTDDDGDDEPREPAPTREQLKAESVDDLADRIRAWNASHDEAQHLAVSGRKAELVGRLLDAYEDEQQPSGPLADLAAHAVETMPPSIATPAPVAVTPQPAAAGPADLPPGAVVGPAATITPEPAPAGVTTSTTAGTTAVGDTDTAGGDTA